jgi:hypothetical protein
MEVGVQGRGLVLRSRLRLEYAVDFVKERNARRS